ncbi:hypothetical protein [Pedobacter sp. UC225_65]|uniref:hypothetical protein n=1 Tax=Pedobacter sp. UC225_65 TaxID=3350173 RepID=UPI00366EA582
MKSFPKVLFALTFLVVIISSCKKDEASPATPKIVTEAKTILNVAYGNHGSKIDGCVFANQSHSQYRCGGFCAWWKFYWR